MCGAITVRARPFERAGPQPPATALTALRAALAGDPRLNLMRQSQIFDAVHDDLLLPPLQAANRACLRAD
jgi:hypothetical protein